jgi:hypothetical protein
MRISPSIVCVAVALGCGAPVARQPPAGTTTTNLCTQGDPRNSQICYVGTSGGEAASLVGTGGVVWAAGGCKIAGCEPPLTCNKSSGFCQRPRCDEGQTCPNETHCNLRTRRCDS